MNLDITESTRSGDVIEMIAKEIDLNAYLDFKLVICDQSKKSLKVLDDDEIIFKVYSKYHNASRRRDHSSIFSKL